VVVKSNGLCDRPASCSRFRPASAHPGVSNGSTEAACPLSSTFPLRLLLRCAATSTSAPPLYRTCAAISGRSRSFSSELAHLPCIPVTLPDTARQPESSPLSSKTAASSSRGRPHRFTPSGYKIRPRVPLSSPSTSPHPSSPPRRLQGPPGALLAALYRHGRRPPSPKFPSPKPPLLHLAPPNIHHHPTEAPSHLGLPLE
jgi:hypothetical protein